MWYCLQSNMLFHTGRVSQQFDEEAASDSDLHMSICLERTWMEVLPEGTSAILPLCSIRHKSESLAESTSAPSV